MKLAGMRLVASDHLKKDKTSKNLIDQNFSRLESIGGEHRTSADGFQRRLVNAAGCVEDQKCLQAILTSFQYLPNIVSQTN